MILEQLKTILLTLLVLLSILLTWELWTYQPQYEFISEDPQYISEISIGTKRDLIDIVKPNQIIYHVNEQTFGTEKASKIASFYLAMQKWTYSGFRLVPRAFTDLEQITSLENSIEVIFPSSIPTNMIAKILNINDLAFQLEGIDRMVLSENLYGKNNEMFISFVSFDEQRIVQAQINNLSYTTFEQQYLKQGSMQQPYVKYNNGIGTILYIIDEPVTLKAVTYTSTKLEAENQFKDVLFSNPNFVKRTRTGRLEDTYTDGKRALEVFHDISVMKYINPVQQHSYQENKSEVVMQSFNFINSHSGWTDIFLYNEWDKNRDSVIFRLNINNYPVFSSKKTQSAPDVATIYVSWRDDQVYEYIRSLINFQRILVENSDVQLASGSELISYLQYLEEMHHFNPLLLTDIKIGFEMKKINANFIFLKPSWFIKYNGDWQPLNYEKENKDGLE